MRYLEGGGKWLLRAGSEAVSAVLDALIRSPLSTLYWQGPPLGGYGFWHGTPPADVCASLTRIPASFWDSSLDAITECAILRDRQFTSFFVAVSMGVYVCVLYQLVQFALFRVCVLRPLMKRAQVVMLADEEQQQQQRGGGRRKRLNNDDHECRTVGG